MKIALVFQAGNFVGREYYRVLCAAGMVPDWCLSIGAMSDSSIEYEKRRTGGLWNPPPIENDVFHYDKWEEMVNVLGHADVAIQAGCGMIGRISLALPRLGWIGVHPGRIPDYRGANCPEWAFLNGEWTTQLSAYWLTEDLDLGPIITHGAYSYHSGMSYEAWRAGLYPACAETLARALSLISEQRRARPVPRRGIIYPRMTEEQIDKIRHTMRAM